MGVNERLYASGNASNPPLWLDHWRYTQRLLLQAQPIPWLQAREFDAFFRKADGLLDADVIVLPLLDLLDAHARPDSDLVQEMGSKQRPGFAAKALLRDPVLRTHVGECVGLVVEAAPHKPLVVSIPSPQGLLGWAHTRAHGAPCPEVSVDSADSCAMYLSDLLSALAECRIAGVMAEETAVELADYLPVYSSVRNVCSYQHWSFGVRVDGSTETVGPFDFAVTTDVVGRSGGDVAWGAWLPDALWATDASFGRPTSDFLYGQVPADSNPERVLQRREELRGV